MKLYVTFGKQDSLKEFLELFFSCELPYEKYVRGSATYYDLECTQLHCIEGKLRSFDDILDLVNTYYDNIEAKELIHTLLLLDIKRDDNPLYLHIGNCSSIKRIRMLYVPERYVYPSFIMDKHDSKYSWEELFNMVDVKTKQDIINYKSKINEEVQTH